MKLESELERELERGKAHQRALRERAQRGEFIEQTLEGGGGAISKASFELCGETLRNILKGSLGIGSGLDCLCCIQHKVYKIQSLQIQLQSRAGH